MRAVVTYIRPDGRLGMISVPLSVYWGPSWRS